MAHGGNPSETVGPAGPMFAANPEYVDARLSQHLTMETLGVLGQVIFKFQMEQLVKSQVWGGKNGTQYGGSAGQGSVPAGPEAPTPPQLPLQAAIMKLKTNQELLTVHVNELRSMLTHLRPSYETLVAIRRDALGCAVNLCREDSADFPLFVQRLFVAALDACLIHNPETIFGKTCPKYLMHKFLRCEMARHHLRDVVEQCIAGVVVHSAMPGPPVRAVTPTPSPTKVVSSPSPRRQPQPQPQPQRQPRPRKSPVKRNSPIPTPQPSLPASPTPPSTPVGTRREPPKHIEDGALLLTAASGGRGPTQARQHGRGMVATHHSQGSGKAVSATRTMNASAHPAQPVQSKQSSSIQPRGHQMSATVMSSESESDQEDNEDDDNDDNDDLDVDDDDLDVDDDDNEIEDLDGTMVFNFTNGNDDDLDEFDDDGDLDEDLGGGF